MPYTVVVTKKIQKEINRIDKRYRKRITAALVFLGDDPYMGKKLEGDHKHQWSLRVWPYRIVYEIEKNKLIVLIVKIAHRQGVYK